MSALPPKADMCGAQGDVRFVPIADIVSDTAQQKTPALSPEGFQPQINFLGDLLPLPAPYQEAQQCATACKQWERSRQWRGVGRR